MKESVAAKPKYKLIFEQLHTSIRSGKYSVGQRLPSETQLVRKFRASRPTVARAMRDLERAGVVTRRVGSGTYVQTAARTSQSVLGLLIPGLGDTGIFEPICGEIARGAREKGFTLLWTDCGKQGMLSNHDRLHDMCQRYIEQNVAGVFFAPATVVSDDSDSENNLRIAEAFDRAGIPIVLLDRDLAEYPDQSNHDLVGIDNHRAGYLLADHLVKLGCRRVDFIVPPDSQRIVHPRIAGYRDALLSHGIQPQSEWIRVGDVEDDRFFEQLIRKRSEALLCTHDLIAGQLMQRLMAAGFRVPEDFRVVGIDDARYATLLPVPLTTVRQPCCEIGAAALDTMMQRIANPRTAPRHIQLPCRLIVRRSCGSKLDLAKLPQKK
jgi:DNA-binding LacI/PurR family transcriptional regulator